MNVRGARVHRYPLWTFGELAYITFDRDDAARACAALRFHALPVHVRKGFHVELLTCVNVGQVGLNLDFPR